MIANSSSLAGEKKLIHMQWRYDIKMEYSYGSGNTEYHYPGPTISVKL